MTLRIVLTLTLLTSFSTPPLAQAALPAAGAPLPLMQAGPPRRIPSAPAPAPRGRDSLLNGALVGAAAGLGSVLLLCRAMEPWDVCFADPGPLLTGAALGAAIGAGLDSLFNVRGPVYETPSGSLRVDAAPLVRRRGGGLRVSVRF